MRISIESTVLADPSTALGRLGPSGLSVNGQEIVEEADFFRAAARTFFHRGSAGVALQFSVERLFTTLRQAERFVLMHSGSIPKSGLVTCEVGEGADTELVYLRNAVVDAVLLPGYRGLTVGVQYTIRGPFFESDIPEEELPGEPEPGEEELVTRRARVPVPSGVSELAVLFSAGLSTVPTVLPHLAQADGNPVITCALVKDSVTTEGFTVQFSATTPDNTYQLHYVAIE